MYHADTGVRGLEMEGTASLKPRVVCLECRKSNEEPGYWPGASNEELEQSGTECEIGKMMSESSRSQLV